MTISQLCDQVLVYLQSIGISNKNTTYTPSGSLVSGGNIDTYYVTNVQRSISKNVVQNGTVYHYIKTNENINSVYRASVTNDRIKNDWIAFKNTYISKMLNANDTISLSSMFVFIYLVRCFINTRFALFTDVYHTSYVWLYNTSQSVNYNVNDNIVSTTLNDMSGITNLKQIVNACVDEITSRNYIHILKSTVKNA